mgnify:CR=1 FL=1
MTVKNQKSIVFKVIFLLILFFNIHIVYAQEFNITSKNVILYNMNEEKVLYQLKDDEKVQIASLTKIMTTIVAIENEKSLDEKVTITKEMLKGIEEYTQVGFKVGDTPTVKDLLYGSMLPSGADAVNALAISTSGSITKFVELMNEKAKQLNLTNTHFDNPVGMDSKDNYSSAKDMAKLLIYSLKNKTFKEVFTAREYKIESINKTVKTTLIGYSRSYGLDVSQMTGAKSGFTDGAGLCLASTATIDDVNYLLITLGANTKSRSNAVKDSLEIYDYYSTNYSYQTILKKDQKIKTIPIKWGHEKEYNITSTDDLSLYLSNDIRKNRIKYTYSGIEEINYKIKKGSKLGTIKITYEKEELASYDVYLNKELKFYHPVLYGIIIILVILIIYSLKYIIQARRYKKNRK